MSFEARNKFNSSTVSSECPLSDSLIILDECLKTAKIGDPGKILPFFTSLKFYFGKMENNF